MPESFYRYLREAHDRTTARWPAAPWMLARASAKRILCQEVLRKDARSWSVAQLGARKMLLCSLFPEYADGPLNLYESDASVGNAKTPREARLTPFETD